MLCKPDLELFDTMSCFEVLDKKMDSRAHRNEALTVKKAINYGILKENLSPEELHALLQELIIQFATWQDQAPLIQQTVYSNLYLASTKHMLEIPVLRAFCTALLYLIHTFYRNAISTNTLREEDVGFPPSSDQFSRNSGPVLKDRSLESIFQDLDD